MKFLSVFDAQVCCNEIKTSLIRYILNELLLPLLEIEEITGKKNESVCTKSVSTRFCEVCFIVLMSGIRWEKLSTN